MIVLFESPDRCGKSTQSQLLYNKLWRLGPTHSLHYSNLKGASKEESLNNSIILYSDMFNLLLKGPKNRNFILDRSHIGEYVYAPMYRGYDGSYIFDIEKQFMNNDNWNLIYLVTFIDKAENIIKRDDGLSFSTQVENKKKEINSFVEASKKSYIKNKIVIDINGKSIEEVEKEVDSFLNI